MFERTFFGSILTIRSAAIPSARRSDYPRLSHASAEHFPVDAPLFDERVRTRNHRSHRSAQSLRQTEHHRIDASRHLRDVISERCSRIKNARTVQVHF